MKQYPTLEITTCIPENGCVINCIFCPQETLKNSYKGERYLSFDNFKLLIDKVSSNVRITFSGFVEPWLNSRCTDMILYAFEKGHEISVFTTGIGLNINDMERIAHIPFSSGPNGGFTLHLPDAELYAKHPITQKYIDILTWFKYNKIYNLNIMCMGKVHPAVFNIFKTAPIYNMWSRAGNLVKEMLIKPELLNYKNNWNSIYHGNSPKTCNCIEHLYHNVLLPNGDISLCCMDYSLNNILGNLYNNSYEFILPEINKCFEICRYCENGIDKIN
jgi:hypothetical protein